MIKKLYMLTKFYGNICTFRELMHYNLHSGRTFVWGLSEKNELNIDKLITYFIVLCV